MMKTLTPTADRDLPTGRHHRRRQHLLAEVATPTASWQASRRLALGAGLAFAVLLVLMVGLPGDRSVAPAAADVDPIDVDGISYIAVTFTAYGEDTSAVEADLIALGLDITIDLVPASPTLVGELVSFDASQPLDGAWDGDYTKDGVLYLPASYGGTMHLRVGRPTEPGEAYVSAADPLAPGEALHCTDLIGMPVAEATLVLTEAGLEPEWRIDDKVIEAPDADTFVEAVASTSPTSVIVWTATRRALTLPDPTCGPS